MICYSITIGTIDGSGTGDLHTKCAIIFFIIWFIVIVRITYFINQLRHWDTSVISSWSMKLKNIITGYVVIVWIYCWTGQFFNTKSSLDFTVIL